MLTEDEKQLQAELEQYKPQQLSKSDLYYQKLEVKKQPIEIR